MKILLVLLMVGCGLTFSLLTFAQTATQANIASTVSQTSQNYFERDNHNWELLIMIGVLGFTGIRNRNSQARKLNSDDSQVQIQKKN